MASSLSPMIPHSTWLLFLSFLFVFHSSVIPLCHSQSTSPQNIETFYPTPPPSQPGQRPAPPTGSTGSSSSSSSSNRKIATAVAATAAATFVVCGLIFFIVHRCLKRRRKREAVVVPQNQIIDGFERIGENVRGLIVDENGLDVVYWRKLQGRSFKRIFKKSSAPPTSPPLQSVQARKNSPPQRSRPRPPPAAMKSSSRPPTSRETPTNNGDPGNSSGEGMSESGNGQVKLKPLHWERMKSKGDHSKVRDKADAGSFSVDQDLMEALFGYVAINRRSPKGGRTDSSSQSRGRSSQGQLRL
ncbi:hypothetical protein K1719_017641 [Acacia pycnantha]|nr:hypothetical protein K1719_017641 [Acacia pycnantha]